MINKPVDQFSHNLHFVKQKSIVHIKDTSVPQRAQLETVQQKFGLIEYFEHF